MSEPKQPEEVWIQEESRHARQLQVASLPIILVIMTRSEWDRLLIDPPLKAAGFNVVFYERTGLNRALRTNPRLIILNLGGMHEQTALDICRVIQRHPRTQTVTLIMLTKGENDQKAITCGNLLAAAEYLVQPFTPEELVATIRRQLSEG